MQLPEGLQCVRDALDSVCFNHICARAVLSRIPIAITELDEDKYAKCNWCDKFARHITHSISMIGDADDTCAAHAIALRNLYTAWIGFDVDYPAIVSASHAVVTSSTAAGGPWRGWNLSISDLVGGTSSAPDVALGDSEPLA